MIMPTQGGDLRPVPDYEDDDILFISRLERMPIVINSKISVNVICFCKAGTMEIVVGGKRVRIERGDVLVCPSDVRLEHPLVSPDYEFSIIAISDRLVQSLLSSNMDVWNRAMYIRKAHVVHPGDEAERKAHIEGGLHFTELIRLMLSHRSLTFQHEIIRALLHAILLAYCALQRGIETEAEGTLAEGGRHTQQGHVIFNRFMKLLRDEPRKHQPVYAYAQRLSITPKHLSHVCRQVSGKSASELIQAVLTDEISARLRDPSLSVKEIAAELGFENLSFFGKFVRARLGVSPKDYRRQLHA